MQLQWFKFLFLLKKFHNVLPEDFPKPFYGIKYSFNFSPIFWVFTDNNLYHYDKPMQNRSFAQSLHFRDFEILKYGNEVAQALILNKIPGFAKPSYSISS